MITVKIWSANYKRATNRESCTYLRNNVTTVHETTSHVLAMTRVAFRHHVGWFKDRACNFGDGEGLMIRLFSADDRGIRRKQEVNTRIWHQVCLNSGQENNHVENCEKAINKMHITTLHDEATYLELCNINIQGTVETKRSSKGTDNLGNQAILKSRKFIVAYKIKKMREILQWFESRVKNYVNKGFTHEIGVSWALNVKIAAAHVVESFVVQTEGTISVLQEGMG